MKILKVIVDELPESCGYCVHGYHNGVNGRCSVFGIVTLSPKRIDADIYETSRPDWCPLVTMGQIDFDSLRATWEREYYEKLKRGDL